MLPMRPPLCRATRPITCSPTSSGCGSTSGSPVAGRGLVVGCDPGSRLRRAIPAAVSEMVLGSIAMTNRADVRWFATDAGQFFPEQWAAFKAGVPPADREGDLVAAYDRLLNGRSEPAVRLQAARDWVAWEDAVLSLDDGDVVPNPRYADERFTVAFARLVTHYFSHAAWLEEDELLRDAPRLVGIPAVLIHGRRHRRATGCRLASRAGLAGRRAASHRQRPHRRRRRRPHHPRVDRPVRREEVTPIAIGRCGRRQAGGGPHEARRRPSPLTSRAACRRRCLGCLRHLHRVASSGLTCRRRRARGRSEHHRVPG